MSNTPDFVICFDCESPIYTFEWDGSKVTEAVCDTCGNDHPSMFSTEEEFEELSGADVRDHGSSDE